MAEHKNEAYLNGKLLLAMPAIGDQRFCRAVIFLCAHDANGAMGLVINRSLPEMHFTRVLENLGLSSGVDISPDILNTPIICGGPVEPGRGFLLHSSDFTHDDTIKIDENLSVTGTVETLENVAGGNGPERFLFILGYAGWSAGQLEEEIRQNAWLVAKPSPDIVFHGLLEEKWGLAAETLGFDPLMLSSEAGRA